MKRLSGVTMAERLKQPGPQQPMLRALIEVCQAIDLAHARNVDRRRSM